MYAFRSSRPIEYITWAAATYATDDRNESRTNQSGKKVYSNENQR